jgi:Domain of unknown function (DUF4156)
MKYIIFLFIPVLTLSCTHNKSWKVKKARLNRNAETVRVIKKTPQNCRNLGFLTSYAVAPESGAKVWEYAMNDLRNKAAYRGGNTVVMEKYKHSNSNNSLKVTIQGRLFSCYGNNNSDNSQPPKKLKKENDKSYDSVKPSPPPASNDDIETPPSTEKKPATPPPVNRESIEY